MHGLKCFIIGEGALLTRCSQVLLENQFEICGIISDDSAVAGWAESHSIPCQVRAQDPTGFLESEPFDYLFSIVNLSIIPDEQLQLPRKCAINFHDGPLPRYAGLNATSWAILNGEPSHGISWHIVCSKADAGDLLKQRTFDVAADETSVSLNIKCHEAAFDAFRELAPELAAGSESRSVQDSTLRSYFGKFKRPYAAALVDWHQSAEEIDRLVRGLDFGRYPNPLGLPKAIVNDETILVRQVQDAGQPSVHEPGTIVTATEEKIIVATSTNDLALTKVETLTGRDLALADLIQRHSLKTGSRLGSPGPERRETLDTLNQSLAKSENFWIRRLLRLTDPELPGLDQNHSNGEATTATLELDLDREALETIQREVTEASWADLLIVGHKAFVGRVVPQETFDIGYSPSPRPAGESPVPDIFARDVPLRVTWNSEANFAEFAASAQTELKRVREKGSVARDVYARRLELEDIAGREATGLFTIRITESDDTDAGSALPLAPLTIEVNETSRSCQWHFDSGLISKDHVEQLQNQFRSFLNSIASDPERSLAAQSILSEEQSRRLLVEWNDNQTDLPAELTIHQLFERQVDKTPEAVALVFENETLTYRELNQRSNQLAHHLRSLGVGRDDLVGICIDRSLNLVIATLGIQKAGGAYVPLDPEYPEERLNYMAKDAGFKALLIQDKHRTLIAEATHVVALDTDWASNISGQSKDNLDSLADPTSLAYVIYTSGSTGKPKGVMVEHGNVVNFFVGMDQRIDHDANSVWLAVTSLSFDISVLELAWTLCRGFKVVVYADVNRHQAAVSPATSRPETPIDFSLFYFSADQGEDPANKYRLLMEGTRFADANGFSAVWTPERHFHNFGGLYPNPAVTGAAIAAITKNVKVRSGSCVSPLHSSIRIAEEWSVVDNISNGRVGLSFASGWMPEDFVLRPENFADKKNVMMRQIDEVRRLWRGETVNFPGPLDKDVAVQTLPRPIQKELPVWVTTAGNPETYQMAAKAKANVLTHLLGQSIEEVAEKIKIYREAWKSNGNEGQGQVMLMLHTFVSDSIDHVKEVVRKPMIDYLRTSATLVKKYSWAFPTFTKYSNAEGDADFSTISPEDMEAILDHAFDRYFETSGLFGTPESCLQMVDRLKEIGVDEIACLIDFGISTDIVLDNLKHLEALKAGSNQEAVSVESSPQDFSVPALIERHGVTHLQCTPSMANMLLLDDDAKVSLRALQRFMVGGEALPASLASQLKELVSGEVINMYGPTETTIWSSTYQLNGRANSIPIGKPIANTDLYILDRHLQPVPIGVAGELLIGGLGVVRGYLNRPELTAERFIDNPVPSGQSTRLYRTGDLARFLPDGNIEFLGRMDHQVKIRGHRIELGEIESRLVEHPSVREAVVIAREDVPGDKRLVAYWIPQNGDAPPAAELRTHVKDRLPEFMAPSHFVMLDSFPQTPNRKIDRKALPAPTEAPVKAEATFVSPQNEFEQSIADIWQEVLNIDTVGTHDNFFDLGGHSLLVVQVQGRLKKRFERSISLTDLFRFPTVSLLAKHLSTDSPTPNESHRRGSVRAHSRRNAVLRRQQTRQVVRKVNLN